MMKRHLHILACLAAASVLALPQGCTSDEALDPDGNPVTGQDEPDDNPDDNPDAPPEEKTYWYKEVTTEPSDWTGEYIITYSSGDELIVLDGFNDKYGTGTDISGELTTEGIPEDIGDKYKATVAVSGSGYTILVTNVGYIGYSGGGNSLSQNTTGTPDGSTDIWTMSSGLSLSPAGSPDRFLRWNTSSPRFACYKETATTCLPVTLFKKEGSSTGDTPGPDDPDDNPDDNPGTQPGTGANTNGWLKNWEVPKADVALEEGAPYSKTVPESLSGGLAYDCDCSNSEQLVVTHTFTYEGRRIRNYTMLFDASKRAALWVAYGMHKGGWPDNDTGRLDNWTYDPAIPSDWQSEGCTSNYHKGHQCASNDRQVNSTANRQTFYYSNQTPQWQTSFNDGVWNQLENAVQNNAPSGRDTLYVVTGPLYGNSMTEKDDGGKVVPIPSGYWKCLMLCSFDSEGNMIDAEGIGYHFPRNEAYSGKYQQYATTIDEVEKLCGFDLFANVPQELQDKAESTSGNPLSR